MTITSGAERDPAAVLRLPPAAGLLQIRACMRGVAWRGVAWRGVAWRGVAWRVV
jgi:hypothetical protein